MLKRDFLKTILAVSVIATSPELFSEDSIPAVNQLNSGCDAMQNGHVLYDDWIITLQDKFLILEQQRNVLEQQRNAYKSELEGIYNSRSWKITKPLRKIKMFLNDLF